MAQAKGSARRAGTRRRGGRCVGCSRLDPLPEGASGESASSRGLACRAGRLGTGALGGRASSGDRWCGRPLGSALDGRGTVSFHTRGRRGAQCAPPEDGEGRGPERVPGSRARGRREARSAAGVGPKRPAPGRKVPRRLRRGSRRRVSRSRPRRGYGEGRLEAAERYRLRGGGGGGGLKIIRLPEGRVLRPTIAKGDRTPCNEVFQPPSRKAVNPAGALSRYRKAAARWVRPRGGLQP